MQKNLPQNENPTTKAIAIDSLLSPVNRANSTKSLNINHVVKVYLLFLTCSLLIGVASAKTIDVGTGYTYADIASGVQAAVSGDSVHVHASSTPYVISTAILMKSGVTLYGDGVSSTIIKMDNRDHFNSAASIGAIMCSSVNNVVIYGLSVTGGEASLSSMYSLSNTYRDHCRGIYLKNCNGVTIHDFNYYLGMGDCIFGSGSSNVVIYNCVFDTPGHDSVDSWSGSNWHIYNIKVNTFINACIKTAATTGMMIDHSTFYCTESMHSGYGGVEIMESGNSITIDHCVFGPMINSQSKGVVTDDADGSVGGTCAITNCIFYQCTGGNYVFSGAHTLTYTTSNIQTPTSLDWATWASEGFGYGATGYSSGGDTTLPPYNGSTLPTLTTPTNGQTLSSTNGKITFSWSNVNSTNYHIQVANDAGFSSILYDQYATSPAVSLDIQNKTCYWRIAAHIDAGANTGTWTNYTSAWNFTASGNSVSLAGVYGTVYDTSVGNPIKGAVVQIWNQASNWSATYVTGDNGQYSFAVPANSGYYDLVVSATGYQTTPYPLPLEMGTAFQGENIALAKNPSYFAPNYVTFTVIDMTGTVYSNVTSTVFKGTDTSSSSNAIDHDTTDYQGNVVFTLDKDVQYTVTFVDPIQNINTHRTIMPADNMYWVVVWGANKVVTGNDSEDQNAEPTPLPSESDLVYVDSALVDKNMTYSTVYWWVNNTDQYSKITFWTLQVVEYNVSANMPVMSADNTSLNYSATLTGSGNSTVMLDVARGHTYRLYWQVLDDQVGHTIYNYQDWTSNFAGINPKFDFGFEDQWNYEALGYACMLLLGGLFGQRSVNVGAICMMFLGGFFVSIGWFPADVGQMMMMSFGCLLVLVYSFTRRD